MISSIFTFLVCSECLKFLLGSAILNKAVICLNIKVGIPHKAGGTLDKYKVQNIVNTKMLNPVNIIKLYKGLKKNPNSIIPPERNSKMNNGGAIVIHPNRN